MKASRQQGVPGQYGDRLAEHLVVGRIAAPEVVVVHGRQVVMDQGIGMDHLHGAGSRHGMGDIAPDRLAGCQHQDRTDPFASGEDRIAHGFVEGDRKLVLLREELAQVHRRQGCIVLSGSA